MFRFIVLVATGRVWGERSGGGSSTYTELAKYSQ